MIFTDISQFKPGDLIQNCTYIVYRVEKINVDKVKGKIVPVSSEIVNVESGFKHTVNWHVNKKFELKK